MQVNNIFFTFYVLIIIFKYCYCISDFEACQNAAGQVFDRDICIPMNYSKSDVPQKNIDVNVTMKIMSVSEVSVMKDSFKLYIRFTRHSAIDGTDTCTQLAGACA